MTVRMIVESFTGRRSIETTFRGIRDSLDVLTARNRLQKPVLRATPWPVGLDSLLALCCARLPV